MFVEKGFEEIGQDIFVYKNFLTQEECHKFTELAKEITEWTDIKDGKFVSDYIIELTEVRERIRSLVPDGLELGHSASYTKMEPNAFWNLHSDDHDFIPIIEKSKLYKEGMPYELEKNSLYGTVVYFNEFKGGEIYYPKQNIIYHQNPGDLVIHSAKEHCTHGVRIVESVRYSNSNHIYNYIKVPKE